MMLGYENEVFGTSIAEQVRPFVWIPGRGCKVCNKVIVDNAFPISLKMVFPGWIAAIGCYFVLSQKKGFPLDEGVRLTIVEIPIIPRVAIVRF